MRFGPPTLLLALTAAAALAADPPPPEEQKPDAPPPAPAPKVNLVPSFSGFAQLQLTAGLDGTGDGVAPTTTVFMRRARVKVKGNVAQGVGYTILVDLATVNNLLRDAYVSTTLVPQHEIRLGQQKTQFGYENPEATQELVFVNFAYASEALARGPDLRDVGIGVLGQWELPAGFGLDYQITAVNGAGPNVLVDDTPRKNVWGRIGGSYQGGYGWRLKVGASGAAGDRFFKADPVAMLPAYKVAFTRYGVDVRADTLWFYAVAEGALGTNVPSTGAGTATAAGGYVMAIGKTRWNVGPLARAEVYDPDLASGGDRLRRYTLGFYVDLKPEELRGQLKAAGARFLVNLDLDFSETRRDHAMLSWVQVVF